jgi:putative ATP-dependent endonuclease of OLD family
MLVEGAAELLLIPPLARKILGIDLEREGISLVAIHGVHFGAYARLFDESCLPKRCAIVADADLKLSDLPDDPVEDLPVKPDLAALEGPFVKVFLGSTTFECEITEDGNLHMLAKAAVDLGATRVKDALEWQELLGGPVPAELKDKVLRTAKRVGKARFAEVAARHVAEASALPAYIREAIQWLQSP